MLSTATGPSGMGMSVQRKHLRNTTVGGHPGVGEQRVEQRVEQSVCDLEETMGEIVRVCECLQMAMIVLHENGHGRQPIFAFRFRACVLSQVAI